MKGISSAAAASSSVFALRCGGGGGGVYGYCSSRSSSYRIVAKKSSNKRQSTSPKGSQPPPPRITTNVKQNLRVLKLWKEFRKNKGVAKPATSYRKKKVEKEDLPEETESYQDPTLSLNNTHQEIETALPVMLVDGYNVCGYWVKLKTHFLGGRLDIARQTLIEELIAFSTIQEVKVVVVFDAPMSGLPTHKETFYGIDIVFSGKTCADSWIEKEVAALKEDGCPTVWVVTSDRCQQDVAHGTGAYIWSCKTLISEIEASQREVKRLQQERCHSVQGKLLKHNLDPKVVDELKDLRNKLYQIELSSKDQKKKKKLSYTADHVSLSPSVQGKLSKNNLDSEVVVAVKDLGDKLPQNELCSKDQKRKEKMSYAAENVSLTPSVNGKLSKLNFDPKVVDALKDLRNKLAQNELRS